MDRRKNVIVLLTKKAIILNQPSIFATTSDTEIVRMASS